MAPFDVARRSSSPPPRREAARRRMTVHEADEDDDALMARAATGDAGAADVLIARHGPRALALARAMLRDAAEAEDVAQEAMLRLWKQAPRWRAGEARVGTWLHRVVSNLAIDRMRRRRRLSGEEPPEREDESPGALERLGEAQRRAALLEAMDSLPDRQRAALALRHFAEMSNPQIAERLGLSIEAVESLLARGRRGLARRLAPRREALGL